MGRRTRPLSRACSAPSVEAGNTILCPPGEAEKPRRHSVPTFGVSGGDANVSGRARGIMKVLTLDESLHSSYRRGSTVSSSSDELNRSVGFGSIEIRKYKRILGDNPSVTSGPPLSIGWEVEGSQVFQVEEFESCRAPRDPKKLLLPRMERERLILESGHSRREMATAIRDINRTKGRRRTTELNLGRSTLLEEALQSASRKLKRALGNGKKLDYEASSQWEREAERAMRAIYDENIAAEEEKPVLTVATEQIGESGCTIVKVREEIDRLRNESSVSRSQGTPSGIRPLNVKGDRGDGKPIIVAVEEDFLPAKVQNTRVGSAA